MKSQGRLVTRMLGLGWDPPRSQSSRYPPAQAWNLSLSLSLRIRRGKFPGAWPGITGITVTVHFMLRPILLGRQSASVRARAGVSGAGFGLPARRESFPSRSGAHAFSLAQPRGRGRIFVAFEQVGEAGKSLTSRGEIRQGVIAEAEEGARARPRPVFRVANPVELAPGSASHSGTRRPDEARPSRRRRTVAARSGRRVYGWQRRCADGRSQSLLAHTLI